MSDTMSDTKPLALLIPGLDGTGMLYFRQVKALSARYRVLAWRFGTKSAFELADLTRDLGNETSREPVHSILLVGESFGGLVALDYALRYPDRVRHLMLVNAFPYYRRRLRICLAQTLSPLLAIKVVDRLKTCLVDRTLQWEGILKEDRERLREIVRQVNPASFRRRLELVKEVDLRPRLPEVQVQTTLLASGRDKVVPSVKEARFMAARILCSQVREFPNAGHALLLTPGVCLADIDLEGFPGQARMALR
jgi:pimeloyl-ACP methyl ester carboxylesterase